MNALICLAAATVFQFAANPPRSAGPHVWWHWVNGNVSKAGITADLESMADAGICGAQIIDVGCGIPAGALRFDTDAWYDHVRFAASEAKRLGLSLTVLNCSGFANSGGPWVTPADSMKFTTFSETPGKGPSKFSAVLPRTKDDHGFYRDIAVFAIPAPLEEKLPLGFSYELGFKRTFGEIGTLHVEVSKDGATFEKYADIPVWLSYFGVADFARRFVLFPEARDYRAIRATFDGAQQKVEVKDVRLERSARIAGLTGKTFLRREPVTADETVVPASQALGKADMIDLTAKMADDGRLDWSVPAGNWTIVRLGYVSTGEQNDPPSENGLGLEVDKLDPLAVERHFDAYCGKICRKLGSLAGKPESGFNAVFVDNIEVKSENWTHGFEKEFEKRRGYSIRPYLPVLTGRIVGSLDESERFLWDYRRVIADMFAENYIGTMQRKCHEHGLQFAFEPYGNCPSDNLQLGRYVDIPMGEFWAGAGTDTIAIGSGNVKFSASVNHVWGQRIMAAESFTAAPGPKSGRWLTTPWAVKGQCDNAYASGANRIVYHRFAHQPWTDPMRIPGATMGPWGMHFERTQTWWEEGKEFVRYQTRCQNVLQRPGAWRADALFFCGEDAPNAGGNPVAEHNEFALDAGYKYDVCSADALAALKVEDGKLVSPGGTRYALFVLPDRKEMSIRVLAELERFVAGGVKVCFRTRPVRAAGLVDYPMSDADLARRFAALEPKMLRMSPEQALAKIGLGPDFRVVSGADAKDAARICWMHREVGGEELFFVGNPSRAGKPVVCAFRVAEGEPELWDAESGKSWRPRQVRRNGDYVEVELPFADTGSFFVLFHRGAVTAPVFPTYETVSETPVAGPWTVEFPQDFLPNQLADGVNETRTFDTLSDWSKSEEKGIRYFSGSAVYRKTVDAPPLKPGERLVLDLGKVKDFATVTVNGKTYPALWKGPYAVDLTDRVREGRELDISVKVTNLWPNRMIGDDFLPDDCAWSGDETNPGRHNVGLAVLPDWLVNGTERTSGRVTFSTWRHWTKTDKLLESGLLGPVLLRRIAPSAN